MKAIASIVVAGSIVLCFGPAANAAGKAAKPTLESCKQLATQRGVTGGGYGANRARQDFVAACMKGKQR